MSTTPYTGDNLISSAGAPGLKSPKKRCTNTIQIVLRQSYA